MEKIGKTGYPLALFRDVVHVQTARQWKMTDCVILFIAVVHS